MVRSACIDLHVHHGCCMQHRCHVLVGCCHDAVSLPGGAVSLPGTCYMCYGPHDAAVGGTGPDTMGQTSMLRRSSFTMIVVGNSGRHLQECWGWSACHTGPSRDGRICCGVVVCARIHNLAGLHNLGVPSASLAGVCGKTGGSPGRPCVSYVNMAGGEGACVPHAISCTECCVATGKYSGGLAA